MITRSRILSVTLLSLFLAAGPAWPGQGSVTGAKLDELDLYEDESLTTAKTVEASKIPFPLDVQESTARAIKITFGGRSYWVIRGMVETEGLESVVRKGKGGEDPTGGTRGIR